MTRSRPSIYVQQPIPSAALSDLRRFADVTVFPHVTRRASLEETKDAVRHADYIFALGENPINSEVIDACQDLRLIAAMEIFPTQIDLAAATARGIPVSGLPHSDEITETTAEFTVALMMSVAWGIPRADAFLRSGKWVQYQTLALPATRLRGQQLGIIGLGKIGQGVARRAAAHDMQVAYHDAKRLPRQSEDALGVRWLELDALLSQSDFIAVCVLLTRETEDLVDASLISRMKDGAVLINTSRGRVVDERAVADALASGKLAGAGLDVFRREVPDPNPGPEDSRLLTMPNVVLTPHIGTSAGATREWMAGQVVESISSDVRGDRPTTILNPEVYGERPILSDRIG